MDDLLSRKLSGEEQATYFRLKTLIKSSVTEIDRPAIQKRILNKETIERLRSLGYITV